MAVWHLIDEPFALRSPAIEAGHVGGRGSLIDEDKFLRIKGYLFFPGQLVEELDIEFFNTFLDRAETRFLYLSGCRSSEAGFVFEFARFQIPGILGFRWPINDWAALQFAKNFYEELFEKSAAPCLERAFLSTRCTIRDAFREDKIWAAAMLNWPHGWVTLPCHTRTV